MRCLEHGPTRATGAPGSLEVIVMPWDVTSGWPEAEIKPKREPLGPWYVQFGQTTVKSEADFSDPSLKFWEYKHEPQGLPSTHRFGSVGHCFTPVIEVPAAASSFPLSLDTGSRGKTGLCFRMIDGNYHTEEKTLKLDVSCYGSWHISQAPLRGPHGSLFLCPHPDAPLRGQLTSHPCVSST